MTHVSPTLVSERLNEVSEQLRSSGAAMRRGEVGAEEEARTLLERVSDGLHFSLPAVLEKVLVSTDPDLRRFATETWPRFLEKYKDEDLEDPFGELLYGGIARLLRAEDLYRPTDPGRVREAEEGPECWLHSVEGYGIWVVRAHAITRAWNRFREGPDYPAFVAAYTECKRAARELARALTKG